MSVRNERHSITTITGSCSGVTKFKFLSSVSYSDNAFRLFLNSTKQILKQ